MPVFKKVKNKKVVWFIILLVGVKLAYHLAELVLKLKTSILLNIQK
ncbi:hypothetical protein L9Z41_06590 [Leptospira noguchii]|nr:hypothetical protein [Leptospira noguchii]MCH1915316.1 hypothetical protein [Leptospira noguchii]